MNKQMILVMAGLAAFLFAIGAQAVNDSNDVHKAEKNAAITAANSWLKLVDKGEYKASWNEAASFFKAAVTSDNWTASAKAARDPLGKLKTREIKSVTYTKSLPGAPDGEYVVIQFASSFENKKSAVETVTPMLDKDGVWRVSGYYIK